MKTWTKILTALVAIQTLLFGIYWCGDLRFDTNSSSVLISSLGVMIAFLVAWQIYSTIVIREQVAAMEEKYSSLRDQIFGMSEKSKSLIYGWRAYSSGRIFLNDSAFHLAYESFFKALEYYIDAGISLEDETITDCFDEMDCCLEFVDSTKFKGERRMFIRSYDKYNLSNKNLTKLVSSNSPAAKKFRDKCSELKKYRLDIAKKHNNANPKQTTRTKTPSNNG